MLILLSLMYCDMFACGTTHMLILLSLMYCDMFACGSIDRHIWITLSGRSRNYSEKCCWYTCSSHIVQSSMYSFSVTFFYWESLVLYRIY